MNIYYKYTQTQTHHFGSGNWDSCTGPFENTYLFFAITSLCPGLVEPVKVQSMTQIEMFNGLQRIVVIILLIWEFFTPLLADGFPLESKGQQVSSSLQDSS